MMRKANSGNTNCFSKAVPKGSAGEKKNCCVFCGQRCLEPAVTIGNYGSSLDRKWFWSFSLWKITSFFYQAEAQLQLDLTGQMSGKNVLLVFIFRFLTKEKTKMKQ